MIKSELESRNADVLKSKESEHPFQNVLRLTTKENVRKHRTALRI